VTTLTHRPDVAEPLLCLSFDDGPGPQTPAILDVLGEHGARGTFFVLGESIEGREEILARTIAEGHEVGNHTFSHSHALDLEEAELEHDIARCQRLLSAAEPVLFRPPYGEDSLRCSRVAARRGLPVTVLWSIDPRDFAERNPDAIAEVIEREAAAGAIVDLHDGFPRVTSTDRDRTPTLQALERAVPRLIERGFRLVTISELLAAPAGES
jgi:peptidoglycan/xylan/chitin deacetylase (PgdA/CDA1 family)